MTDIINVSIPQNLENMQLPSPELLTFYKNIEERTLWLDTEVSDLFLEYGRYIVQWNREDKDKPIDERKPIRLMFFSPGGDLSVNNAMVSLIRLSRTPIYGYNVNMAYSSACFIFMACHKRFALPGSVFLLHRGSGEFSGSYDEVVAQVIEYQRQIDELGKFIMKNSNIDEETLQENLGSEWFVTAQEAHDKYGFVDKIIESLDEIL